MNQSFTSVVSRLIRIPANRLLIALQSFLVTFKFGKCIALASMRRRAIGIDFDSLLIRGQSVFVTLKKIKKITLRFISISIFSRVCELLLIILSKPLLSCVRKEASNNSQTLPFK
jgi:hypothetical protein